MIDPRLLEIVVCPSCRSALRPEPDESAPTRLECTGANCGLVYPVRDGVPVLLVDEARVVDAVVGEAESVDTQHDEAQRSEDERAD